MLRAIFKGLRREKRHPYDRYAKLDAFIRRRIEEDIYPEAPELGHTLRTHDAIKFLDEKWPLAGKRVLDVGCGQGVALEKFKEYGADATGLTFGQDFAICRQKGLEVYEEDMSFIDFPDETFDVVWARHSLEHSLFPYFTVAGIYAALKPGGILYAEMPSPGSSAKHELNVNHYSCLTRGSWESLFERVGFTSVESFDLHVELVCGPDIWYAFYLQKPNGARVSGQSQARV